MRAPNGTAARVKALDPVSQARWRRWKVEGFTDSWSSAQTDAAFELLALSLEFDKSAPGGGYRMQLSMQMHALRQSLGLGHRVPQTRPRRKRGPSISSPALTSGRFAG